MNIRSEIENLAGDLVAVAQVAAGLAGSI